NASIDAQERLILEPREADAEHLTVEEEQRAQRLVLGGGGHVALDRQGGEEARDLGRAHRGRVALAVEEDVAMDPRDVDLLGAAAPMASAEGGAYPVEQAGLGRRRRASFTGEPPAPCTTGDGRIPKGGVGLGGSHCQFPVLSSVSEAACVAQGDHPKSCEGTPCARTESAETRAARTEATPSCCCTIPSTSRKGAVTSVRR